MPAAIRDELLGPVETALERAGFELVALKLVPRAGGLSVQVLIDHREGLAAVTLGDCTRASRAIQDEVDLDRHVPGRYMLEVSSPGIDRPLTRPAHYRRFRGQQAVVKLAKESGGGERRGMIEGIDDETVTIELESGERERVPFAAIVSAHLKRDPWKGRRGQTDDDER